MAPHQRTRTAGKLLQQSYTALNELLCFAQGVADLDTWEAHCRDNAEAEGITDLEEIDAYVTAEQADLDYLVDQDNELERIITRARKLLETPT